MSILQSKAERARVEYAGLVKHYRAIGPAAVAAAVCVAKKPLPKSGPAKS